jgi:predicted RNA binding protein YcfA (HicA-like mRNA interferase family)
VDSRTVIRLIEADGWFLVAVSGSHHQFKHAAKPGRVTVAHSRKDLPITTLKSIERQSGLKIR